MVACCRWLDDLTQFPHWINGLYWNLHPIVEFGSVCFFEFLKHLPSHSSLLWFKFRTIVMVSYTYYLVVKYLCVTIVNTMQGNYVAINCSSERQLCACLVCGRVLCGLLATCRYINRYYVLLSVNAWSYTSLSIEFLNRIANAIDRLE